MNPRARIVLIVSLVLAGAGMIGAWWFNTHELVSRVQTLPPKGEPTYNPLYALKVALQKHGLNVQSRQRLDLPAMQLKAGDTLVMLGDANALASGEADALLQWVRTGGHLVLPMLLQDLSIDHDIEQSLYARLGILPGEREDCLLLQTKDAVRKRADDLRKARKNKGGKNKAAEDKAAEDKAVEDKAARDNADDDDDESESFGAERHFCWSPRVRLQDKRTATLRMLDGGGDTVVAWLPEGSGMVTIASDLEFLTNRVLEKPISTELAWRVLQPAPGRGTVHLVYRSQMLPLWRLILERGWMIWLPLLLAVLGGLWAATQRFGPMLPSAESGRRSLLEHLQAAGEHVVRYRRSHLLHQQVLAAFNTRLQRRDPYAAALDGQARIAAISAKTGMDPAEVHNALLAPRPFDTADLRQRILLLTRLRNRL